MKAIARAISLYNVLSCAVAFEGTTSSSTKTGDQHIAKDVQAEIRKEVLHELAMHDVKREVLVQSSIHNSVGEASTMEKLRVLKALEQKEKKNAKLLAAANKKLHEHTKRLRSAFLEERATVKADTKQLQNLKQMQKTTAGKIQKLKAEMHAMQLQTTSLQSSLAQEKQHSHNIQQEFSKLQVSDKSLSYNLSKLSNSSKLKEQTLKKQGLFLLNEIHSTKGRMSELQQREHKMEQENKEKDHVLASFRASMLQEKQKLQTQSQRELQAAKQKLTNLEARRVKEENEFVSQIHAGTSSLAKLRSALAESRSKARMEEQQLATMNQKDQRLQNAQSLLSKDFAQFRSKAEAAQAEKQKDLEGLKQSATQQLQRIASLQELAGRTASQLKESTATQATEKAEISTLNENAMAQKTQLMSSLKEISALQDKLESQAQTNADLARQSLAAQNEAKNEMKLKDMQYDSLTQKFTLSENEASSNENKVKQQSMQLQQLKNQLAAAQASATTRVNALQGQLHSVMLSAANKVRALEDQQEGLQTSLKQTKAALLQASAEVTEQREEVQNANAASLKASREEEMTRNALSASQSAAAAAASNARMAEQTAAGLHRQLTQEQTLVAELEQRTQLVETWQEKAETAQRRYVVEASELQIAKQKGQALSERLEELSDADSRSSMLQKQVQSLREAQSSKDKEIANLKQHQNVIEQLNDQFSKQVDMYTSASKSWHAKADSLQEALNQRTSELQFAQRKRSQAQQVEKDARNQEDVYFEEAQKLQQKYDDQSSALTQAYAASNSSAAEATKFRDELGGLQAEQARDQRNSHAVWVDVERELIQAQKKQAWAQAEISQSRLQAMRAESLLSDEQRKKLGLPPKEKDSPKEAPRKPTKPM